MRPLSKLTEKQVNSAIKDGIEFDYNLDSLMLIARLQDEPKCVACNPITSRYIVPNLCKNHYGDWLRNRSAFERAYWDQKRDAQHDV